jgi:PAS domain S-box-containing protein
MTPPDDSRLIALAKTFSRIASAGIMLLGGLVLVGWAFDITTLKSVFPGLATMKANTALAFVLAGLSLLLLDRTERGRGARLLASFCAVTVALLGVLTLGEYWFVLDFGIDNLLFQDPVGTVPLSFPGRMAPATAFCFLLNGAALLLITTETPQGYRSTQVVALLPGTVSFIALVGYAYSARELYSFPPYSSMALHTALGFLMLSAGILCARPEYGLMRIMVSDTTGGTLARRILLPSLGVLVGLGWLRLLGERAGLYSLEFSGVLTVAAEGVLFVALVWINAVLLDRLDGERKRREEALRESEDRYRNLFENASDGIVTFSMDGTVTTVNRGFEEMTGWSREEVIGQDYRAITPPASIALTEERTRKALAGERLSSIYEAEIIRKDGSAVSVEARTRFIYNRERKPVGFQTTARDITERKQAEAALHESEKRFRAIFENAAIGIGLSNMEGHLIRSNPAMQGMLGYSQEELRRMVFTDFTHPDDRGLDWNLFRELVENRRESYQREKRYIRKDGSLIWVRLTVSLVYGNAGEPQFAVGMVEDITTRKQAEEALQRSEEYFRALIENASDIITILSAEGIIMYESPAFERVFGYAPEEVIGRDAAEFVHPEDLAKVRNAFARRIQKPGSTASVEFRFLHKDGSWRVLESIGKNMLDNPAVKGIISNSRDVTERKLAEHALQASEERFRSLSASAPVGIFSNDVEGACVYINPCWLEIAGMTLEESLGTGWVNAIAFEDRESVVAEWQTCVREGREFSREFRFRRPNGEVRWVRARAAVLRSDSGARLGYVGTTEDFTERRRANMELERLRRQLELILTSVADGIYVLDRQGRTTFVNPAAARMVGYCAEELVGQPMHGLVHHSKPNGTPYPAADCQIYAALVDGAVHHVTNEVFWRKDGNSFPVEYRSAPIREQDGEIVGAAVTFRDVSEQRAVDKMKDEFISVVSHELRTPLTSIRGALGLLTSGLVGEFPERGQRMLEIATNNTERLVRLINDILDIERMRSGKVTMQRQVCDAATLIIQATDEMRAMADKAGVTLSVSPQPIRLWADPDRVIQTLTNLLSNAIKFSPEEGGKVWLSVAQEGGEAKFTIKDQGRGIPADKLDSIFERFQQVDASDSRKRGGTGLGLAICRSIVQQHGGRIWAESGPGEGSTFFFTLPTLPEVEQDVAPTEMEKRPVVLVCDDDPAILEVVRTMLDQHGYQPLTVNSGSEAVRQALARRPAAILLDLVMPGMNGCETLMTLKERPETKSIPVIILSGLQPPAKEGLPSGATDWLHKPFDEGSLFLTLKHALDEHARGTRVLVVEDDPDLAGVLRAMFERHGIETFHAKTGREALQFSQRTLPDLLVLDLGLPDGDGFSVVDWLRLHDQLRQVPLVVYTAKDLDEAERQRLKLGQTQFFTKGRITPEDFEQRVIGWLNRLIPA